MGAKRTRVQEVRVFLDQQAAQRLDRTELMQQLVSIFGCPSAEAALLAAEYTARQRVRDAGLDVAGVAGQVDRLLFGHR